mgnify:CR=1 FL=1
MSLPFNQIPPRADFIFRHLRAIQNITYKQEEKEEQEYREAQEQKTDEEKSRISHRNDSDYLSSLKYLVEDLRKLSSVIRDIEALAKSLKAKLANDPFVLLLGEAGMGKTHLLCDVTKDRFEDGCPTFMVLGEEMPKMLSPIKSLLKSRNISETEAAFLKEINCYGAKKRRRVLLVFDALNESDIKGWKRKLREFKLKMSKYPWIGVVLSCRTPFENIVVPKRLPLNKEYHTGFNEYEFEAMKAYFKHYRIPLPEVPVLISEFGSPLFLSSFCKTAASIRGERGKVAKRVKDIALGQSGMTKILEDFYIAKQQQIFQQHSKDFNGIITSDWLWNKTSGATPLVKFLAQKMAEMQKESLLLNEVIEAIEEFLNSKFNQHFYTELLDLLVQHGVVIKDLSYDVSSSSYQEVVKFPFQKFSDHLVARYFLEEHLKTHQPKKCLSPSTPLGKLFKDEISVSERANLVEAIVVEFPERIKRNKKAHNKDIVDYIPKDVRDSHIFREIYLRALYWRRPENFQNGDGKIKDSIIDYFNKSLLRYEHSSKELLDLLITTAIKPRHPLSHKALSNWLAGMTMASRDVFWTEYLRKSYDSDPIYRLITWIEEHDITKMSEEHAEAIVITLSWFFTSTSHALRNRAAKCLYLAGSQHPKACFSNALNSLKINDPYIHELTLATAYGVAMRFRVKEKENLKTRDEIGKFAKVIFDTFFKARAPFSTTHIYTRDYARGIVELAINEKLIKLSQRQLSRIRPPYTSGGIRRWGRSKDKNDNEYRDGNAPLGMDFENYTLGRLVEDRNNYDFKNKEWVKVKSNVLWRIYQLGYSLERFGDIDKQIVSSQRLTRSDYPEKVDRYGKKYSWIAYYELMGYRVDKNLTKSYFGGNSYRESESAIDPSFPMTWSEKYPIETDLLRGPREMKRWLKEAPTPDIDPYVKVKFPSVEGHWVLIEGTIGQLNESAEKRNSIYIDGVFVSRNKKKRLVTHLKKVEYVDDRVIPNLPEVRYEYLGELGWHPDYGDLEGVLKTEFVIGHKKVRITKTESLIHAIRIQYGDEILEQKIDIPTHRDKPVYEKIDIRVAARYCASKDYRKIAHDEGLGLYIPSNSLIRLLNLHKDKNTFNFRDKDGKLATISVIEGGPYRTHKNLLYVREDLFEKLKSKYQKDFLLCAHGERQFWSRSPHMIDEMPDFSPIYQAHENTHRQFIYL